MYAFPTRLVLLSALLLKGIVCATEPGFEPLFDGRSLDGWTHNGNWTVRDGVIARTGKGGSLTYTQQRVPDDFELRFDWKIAKGGNSGVYYRPGQYEYQLLDNANSPYGENPRQSAGSLFFCMAPSQDVARPFGEWNEARIVCKGTVIQHWLNDVKVVDFDYTDPRWAKAVELLSIRGGDLTQRGAHLSLQEHGADVWFRHLRWRAIPADEPVISDALPPMPIPAPALAKENARLRDLMAKRSPAPSESGWRHEELRRFPAAEANQGVAVDDHHFYAITNRAIGKYRKDTGEKVGSWEDAPKGRLRHLNAGWVLDGKLYCAHSNFPAMPEVSTMEIWDTATLTHQETHRFEKPYGSLTWVVRGADGWFACFAQYAKTGDPAQTRLVRYDERWQETGFWFFPAEVTLAFGGSSASGGAFGPGGRLFVSGHDRPELYILDVPAASGLLRWRATLPVSAHGQAFAWDLSQEGILYSIERKTREVIVSRITAP